jgi:hypothetical protein
VPGYDKIPTYLNPEQRNALTHIPPDFSDREIARYYTFTEKERELVDRRRQASNRLGFAVQLALLKFPGRILMEVKEVPKPVLAAIAEQVGVPASAFTSYGDRENTLYEHLDELRRECGFRSCGWREYLLVAKSLLPDAMESDRPLPLIERALELLLSEGILAPNMIYVERLVWVVLKFAERRLLRTLTQPLMLELRARLDGLLYTDTSIRGATRKYFRDEALRRRVLIGLNKGEALHALARQLFFGRLGELRDRAFEDQMHHASCLHLIMAAIAAWNTVYLTKAIATLRKRDEDIPEATVAHIAQPGWKHIRLIGDYHFAPQSGRSLENLRPLRLQEGEESI